MPTKVATAPIWSALSSTSSDTAVLARTSLVGPHPTCARGGSIAKKSLQDLSDGQGRPQRYSLPRGDWFEYVSSPHYLSEILIYCGILMLDPWNRCLWMVLLWVIVNLSITATRTHVWYHRTFRDYPLDRNALLPKPSSLPMMVFHDLRSFWSPLAVGGTPTSGK